MVLKLGGYFLNSFHREGICTRSSAKTAALNDGKLKLSVEKMEVVHKEIWEMDLQSS